MKEPLVCAVMLTKDRPEMAARAVRSFREQTYQNKRLLVLDSSEAMVHIPVPMTLLASKVAQSDDGTVSQIHIPESRHTSVNSIGHLRNSACSFPHPELPDIFITFDDDDCSHPNRIAEQVAHLQSSGADVVGYNELLFWRTHHSSTEAEALRKRALELKTSAGGWTKEALAELGIEWPPPKGWLENLGKKSGEAWLYKNVRADKSPGTTLCYWRKTWERKPFPDLPKAKGGTGEDSAWLQDMNVAAVSTIQDEYEPLATFAPRMIASIHGGNTMPYDLEAIVERGGGTNWKRVPEWDNYCRGRMAL